MGQVIMSDLSEWSIIIVDDEPDNLDLLNLIFSYGKAHVRVAASGQQCLEYMQDTPPNVMLVDIQMPGMSGYELLNRVRANPHWAHIPVIAVTAHAMDGDQERVLSAGFEGYIPKPIEAMRIVDQVQAILQTKGA
jgi:two-component system cell cycle response regulator DivK